jgi:hypothetical protein
MQTPLPTSLGDRFAIEEALPETPFERCFRAHDRLLKRDVLLKLPGRGAIAAWSTPIQDRMLREARALAKIRHEAVAAILWVENTPDGLLLVLEPPAGESLAERLQRGPLEVAETVSLGVQIGNALGHVHAQGIVHRAVGPAAIRLLGNGKAQLGAFTFAKEFGLHGEASSIAHARLEDPATVVHLPAYAAPEQFAGQAADARADVFALGCTLFRCLTGRDPFPAGQPPAAPPDPRRLRPEVGRALAEVVQKCMLFAKSARFSTAQDVVAALQAAAAAPTPAPPSRRGWIAAASVAAVATLLWGARGLWDDDSAATRGDGEPQFAARQAATYRPDYARVHGLFVAIGEAYAGSGWQPLANPVREVDAVVAQLQANDPMWRAPGAVATLRDREATYDSIRAQLERLVAEAEPDDAVLVYFAGHGARQGDSFGLCTADVRGAIENGTGYLRRETLTTFLKRCAAKHVLVVLDCCHSGAVFDVERGRSVDEERAAAGAHHRRRFSREFLCSAGADQPAADGAGLSPFCRLLLEELRRPATAERDFVAARHLAGRIGEAMDLKLARCGMPQLPAFHQGATQQGSFVFRLAAAAK